MLQNWLLCNNAQTHRYLIHGESAFSQFQLQMINNYGRPTTSETESMFCENDITVTADQSRWRVVVTSGGNVSLFLDTKLKVALFSPKDAKYFSY